MISSPNYTSLSSIAAIFLATCLIVVFQLFRYSIFHGGNTLFDSVFHDGVTPISVLTLKPPQGSILSLLLSNIILHEFNIFMEEYIRTYNKEKGRKIKWLRKENPLSAHLYQPLLRVIGAILLKPQASPIVETYI